MEVRIVDAADGEGIAAMYAPFVTESAVSFETIAPSGEEIGRRIQDTIDQYPWLVADDAGTLAGYTYARRWRTRHAYDWCAEVTIIVGDAYRRRKVGTALYTALLGILGGQGYTRACGVVTRPNPGSSRLHEAMGFRLAGVFDAAGFKFGQWHDLEFWWATLASTEREDAPPARFADFRNTEACLRELRHATALFD